MSISSAPPAPRPEAPARGPLFGCLVGVAGLVFFACLIAWSLWQGIGQSKAIDTFTVPEPVLQPVSAHASDPSQALKTRLDGFLADLDSGIRSEATFSAADLNHLIATLPPLSDLRGQLHVTSIENGELLCSICFPLNGLPWENRKRYLVGSLRLKPELTDGHPAFRVIRLEVPGKSIPEWFTRQFATYHILERYQNEPAVAARIRQLSAFSAEQDRLVLRGKAWKESVE